MKSACTFSLRSTSTTYSPDRLPRSFCASACCRRSPYARCSAAGTVRRRITLRANTSRINSARRGSTRPTASRAATDDASTAALDATGGASAACALCVSVGAASTEVSESANDTPNHDADRRAYERTHDRARDIDAIVWIALSPLSLRSVPLCASALSRAGGITTQFCFLLIILLERHCQSPNPRNRSWRAAGCPPARKRCTRAVLSRRPISDGYCICRFKALIVQI